MNYGVLRAFRNLRLRDDVADMDAQGRFFIEQQILHFPSWALPTVENAACVCGIVPRRKGSAQIWMLPGEDLQGRVALTVLGQVRSLCASMHEALALHRMDMECDRDFPAAGKWAEKMGFEYETTLARASEDGGDVDVYLWPEKGDQS